MILYSQFAGTRERPTKVEELLDDMGYPNHSFEPIKAKLLNGTSEEHAITNKMGMGVHHPSLKESKFLDRLEEEMRRMLAEQGIEFFHAGFLTVKKVD